MQTRHAGVVPAYVQDGGGQRQQPQPGRSAATHVRRQQPTRPGAGGAGMQISSHPEDVGGARGIRTLTMTNHSNPNSGATILQYAASSDGQFYLPMTVSSNVESYMSSSSSTTPSGVVGAGSPHAEGSEESLRKRQLRLLKNREAARECRRKKKEYVKCLENRVAVLENQNKTLIEEMKAVKDLYFYLEG